MPRRPCGGTPIRFWGIIAVALAVLAVLLYKAATAAHEVHLSYESYLSLVLTALGVMLGILAIVVGIAAIWGYRDIKDRVELTSKQAAETAIKNLIEAGDIQAKLRQYVDERLAEAGDQVFADVAFIRGTADARQAEEERIADTYPEGQQQQ